MEEKDVIINRVANSGLVTLDLEKFMDKRGRVTIDLKDNLFQGLILKEKDFRAFIKQHDWSQYQDKNVMLTCSADAIIPAWAYMLMASKLTAVAHVFVYGDEDTLERALVNRQLDTIDFSTFENAKVVIKGCADLKVPEYTFTEVTKRLMPYAGSIMFGEPCSTVPIYKSPRKK